jgi:hypothetical protein
MYPGVRSKAAPPRVSDSVGPLRRLFEVWKLVVQADPWLRTGRPDVEHGRKGRSIVERRESDGRELRVGLASREQRSATLRAEASSCLLAAARAHRIAGRRTVDLQIRGHDDDARRKGRAARNLAVTAGAVEHRDRRGQASITHLGARAFSGDVGIHVADYGTAASDPQESFTAQ